MFVKWSCGCKGFIVDGHCWVVSACDGDGEFSVHPRDMTDPRTVLCNRSEYDALTEEQKTEMVPKTFEPLPYPEVVEILSSIRDLVRDGYSLRAIKWRLGIRAD